MGENLEAKVGVTAGGRPGSGEATARHRAAHAESAPLGPPQGDKADNDATPPSRTDPESRSVRALLPIMAAVFIAYLVIGLAMPVLPLHVHQGLGLGIFVVGLV